MDNTVVGCDIEENSRFKDKSEAFYDKIFTPAEITYCRLKPNPEQHFAVRYCAKESVVKALRQLGIEKFHYKDIEIIKDGDVPRIVNMKGFEISCTLSHVREYSMAMVLLRKL